MFKKKENPEIKVLQEVIGEIRREYSLLKEEVEKNKRIVKYSSSIVDMPTHRLVRKPKEVDRFDLKIVNDLYIYYKKEEYKISLDVLDDRYSIVDTEKLRIDGDLAYFDVTACHI